MHIKNQNLESCAKDASTGGTRREAEFKQAASFPHGMIGLCPIMTAAERAAKARKRKTLFPQKMAAARIKDAKRHRSARGGEQAENAARKAVGKAVGKAANRREL